MEPQLPLTHIWATDKQVPQCETCTGSHTTLPKLEYSAQAGCSSCLLLQLAIKACVNVGAIKDPECISVWPGKAYTKVKAREISGGAVDRTQPRRRRRVGISDCQIELYTHSGEETCSWPMVGMRCNVFAPRETIFQSVISEWLAICDATHPKCLSDRSPLPSRVLDVSPSNNASGSDEIRLHISNGQFDKYIALSHCWGGGVPVRTTRSTLVSRQNGISFESLPRSFQDAVVVTQALGVRYLWIDALCIVQDDREDWEIESGNMAAVYKKAYVVLGADMAKDSYGGFMKRYNESNEYLQGLIPPRRTVGRAIATVSKSGGRNSIIYARQKEYHVVNRSQPLSTRAWALQEQLLATRMVHFKNGELIWECNWGLRCECAELDTPARNQGKLLSTKKSYHDCLSSHDPEVRSFGWNRILSDYMGRKITQKMDRLPALSGIANEIHKSWVESI